MEKFLKIALCILLVVCIGTTAFIYYDESDSRKFNIYINSELYDTVDLSKVTEPYEISLPHNTLLVESDGVTMISADCPDKICVKRGKMSSGAPIVCAPNSLYITFEKEVDAVACSKQKTLCLWRCFCALLL